MKHRWFVLLLVVVLAAITLSACGTEINDGKIDGLEDLPILIEVTGLESVTGTLEANLMTEAELANALTAVKPHTTLMMGPPVKR